MPHLVGLLSALNVPTPTVEYSNLVGICVRTLLNNIKVDTVSMTERPHFHKSKMAALAAKTFFKFSH